MIHDIFSLHSGVIDNMKKILHDNLMRFMIIFSLHIVLWVCNTKSKLMRFMLCLFFIVTVYVM